MDNIMRGTSCTKCKIKLLHAIIMIEVSSHRLAWFAPWFDESVCKDTIRIQFEQ